MPMRPIPTSSSTVPHRKGRNLIAFRTDAWGGVFSLAEISASSTNENVERARCALRAESTPIVDALASANQIYRNRNAAVCKNI